MEKNNTTTYIKKALILTCATLLLLVVFFVACTLLFFLSLSREIALSGISSIPTEAWSKLGNYLSGTLGVVISGLAFTILIATLLVQKKQIDVSIQQLNMSIQTKTQERFLKEADRVIKKAKEAKESLNEESIRDLILKYEKTEKGKRVLGLTSDETTLKEMANISMSLLHFAIILYSSELEKSGKIMTFNRVTIDTHNIILLLICSYFAILDADKIETSAELQSKPDKIKKIIFSLGIGNEIENQFKEYPRLTNYIKENNQKYRNQL